MSHIVFESEKIQGPGGVRCSYSFETLYCNLENT